VTTTSLTASANLILEILTWKVRVLTIGQVRRIIQVGRRQPPSVAAVLNGLVAAGLLETQKVVLVVVEPAQPLYTWMPGDCEPAYGRILWQLEKRWRRTEARRTTICWATETAAHQFGGVAEFRNRASQVEHDLGTAAVFTRLHEIGSSLAARWIGEMILNRDYGRRTAWLKKRPDAVIFDNGVASKMIEFCGQYSIRRLRRFHCHCRRYALPYDLW
jgi:hypothetical protein